MERTLKWLDPPDPDTNHHQKCEERYKDTGAWFVKGEAVNRWKEGHSSLLWLHGIPGCGKSVLSSTLVESLKADAQCRKQEVVAYFYFDFSDGKKRSTASLVCSLVAQLAVKHAGVFPKLETLFEQHDGRRQPAIAMLLSVLQELVNRFDRLSFVIDGLDESEDVSSTLNVVCHMCSWRLSGLRIFVSSRSLGIIGEAFSRMSLIRVSASEHLVDPDIHIFIGSQVNDLTQWNPETRAAITEALAKRSHGMFRLASCQLDLVRQSRKMKDLRRLLSSLPPTLEDMYERVLLDIPEDERDDTLRALQWLAFSAQPVRMEELSEVLAVDLSEQRGYDPDLKDLCIQRSPIMNSSLVTTSQASTSIFSGNPDYYKVTYMLHEDFIEVRLAHASVKDYLLSSRIRNGRTDCFALDERLANQEIAQTCLLYVLHSPHASGYRSRREQEDRVQRWPLLLYASHFWPHHVKQLQEGLDATTWKLIQMLFQSKSLPRCGNFGAWLISLAPDLSFEEVQKTTPLYYASSFAMDTVVQKLLMTSQGASDINKSGGRMDSTPLECAVFRGNLNTVRLLLNAGANARIESSGNALYWAVLDCADDGPEMVETLLQSGASLSQDLHEDLRVAFQPPFESWPPSLNALFDH